MLYKEILPLITTAKRIDGSYETAFFDEKEQKLKVKQNSSDEWQRQLDITKIGVVMGPGVFGLMAGVFPGVLNGKIILPILIFLFLLIGFAVGYLLKRAAESLSNDNSVQTIFNPSVYLRNQTGRLFIQLTIVIVLLLVSLIIVTFLCLEIFLFGISFINITIFMMASFIFWVMIRQPLFRKVKVYYSLLNER
ncbi:hypothetical protein [Furfurilactobacillus rossiae]|uniref:Uncharacterized protein n=1 Tax=Furfurilactobacillus rossiae DSM 15814 TaxID=1114972 RepID=A0A0R1R5I2_9LACO|nr:hypothetical protein [Furfurilactobacillus rossiae]KRL52351.1 hypothetical protein FD35_GL002113 [Furfurilactobacillus rossiae DSM 15814]QFR65610.1 hypothetical protein LR814_00080 [Furfurilactobacillus rossiae]QLE60998.1 hypothetical protein LROSRS0_0951 [Furfurilactobacillus rossiae]